MIGKKIIHKDTLDSTNNYIAKLLLCEDLLNGTVILADEQSQGRGQRGSQWEAEPFQNIMMSFYLKHDNLSVQQQFIVSQAVSVGVLEFLKYLGLEALIKWPNDLVIGNAKIAGILIENQLQQSKLKSSIVGIGLNVNQLTFGDYNATSLKKELNEHFNIQELVFILLEKLNESFQLVWLFNEIKLKSYYLQNLWLYQILSDYKDQNGTFEAKEPSLMWMNKED
jgi:BirA family transcriptional regulator, biotin operon repressor / biotin---[acetyl-CoA-carboxylase] ligase